MAWLKIIAILLLQKPALRALKDYQKQRKERLDPYFDPTALGISNAEEWNKPANISVHKELVEEKNEHVLSGSR